METATKTASEQPATTYSIGSEGHWVTLLRESRLVAPVVAVWFVIWLMLWITQLYSQRNSEPREYLMATVCCVGVASTVLWCSLYGEFGLRRIVTGLLLLVSFATVVGGRLQPQMIVGIFFIGLLAFVPGWVLRRFLRWRICRFSELSFSKDQRFQIADVFRWTAGAAVLMALLPLFAEVLFTNGRNDNVAFFITFFVSSAIVVPTGGVFCYFTLLSKVRTPYAALLIPFLAAGIAMCIVVTFWWGAPNGQSSFSGVLNEMFWQATICFSLAGFFLLAVVAYLRSQGLYFKVGLADHRSCARRAKAKYEESLQKRIRNSEVTAARSRLELEELSRISVDALA